MKPQVINKRRGPRYAVEDLSGALDIETRADLLNISLFGVAIRAAISLEVGTRGKLELGDEPESVRAASEVRWCRPSHQARDAKANLEGYFDLGLTFERDLSQNSEALLRFLDSKTILKLTQGAPYGRFELDYEVPVSLRHRWAFRVTELSISGMLVETRAALVPELQVELDLPLDDKHFSSLARVTRTESAASDADDTLLQAAVEFTLPTERHLEILESYIHRNLAGGR